MSSQYCIVEIILHPYLIIYNSQHNDDHNHDSDDDHNHESDDDHYHDDDNTGSRYNKKYFCLFQLKININLNSR